MDVVRALLLTDVVDSTHLTHGLGDDAAALLWTAHDRVARDLLPLWHGHEIDKTDGMLLLFEWAADAVGYALAYHRAIAALVPPLTARAGIHVGPVTLRSNSEADVSLGAKPIELDGLAKSIAARVMSTALGAQTLLTADARLALGVTTTRLHSHGHWRLRGVPDTIELFEAGEIDSRFQPPPDEAKAYRVVRQGEIWLPLREVRHSLPAERDSFVGRREPLALLAEKFDNGARLVSVLGMGGTGKTRLATRFAWEWLGEFSGGIWFCDLSQARSVDGIVFAAAQGLDVPLGKSDPLLQLTQVIRGRGDCLVILDNFEQVARHAEETLGHWLTHAPRAQFLVTTREVLGIVGEETLALAPLPADDGTALFMRRAEAAKAGFHASADEQLAIAQLIKVLDGLPLAIELAAARVRVMAPRVLLARMNERFKVLLSRAGRLDRQATMRAAIDWSWELLSGAEKKALAQLSVFRGSFTLEAAEAVLLISNRADAPSLPSVDLLQGLVDKSLVRTLAEDRFDLLESVREYADERLRHEPLDTETGVSPAMQAELRHAAHFASAHRVQISHGLSHDLDNVVAAYRRAVFRRDASTAVDLLEGACKTLTFCGPFRVALELADQLAAWSDLPDLEQARVQHLMGKALWLSGRAGEAKICIEQSLASALRANDLHGAARGQVALAEHHVMSGDMHEARRLYDAALTTGRLLGDSGLQCGALGGLGMLHERLGELPAARSRYVEALDTAEATGNIVWQGGALGNLAQFLANSGDTTGALPLYEQAVAISRRLGDRQWEGNMLCNLGLLHFTVGQQAAARTHLESALQSARDLGYRRLESVVLCNLGIVHEAMADRVTSRQCLTAALSIAKDQHDRRSEGQILGYLGLACARDGDWALAHETLARGETVLRAVGDQVSLGIVLCAQVEAAQLADPAADTRHLVDEITAIVRSTGSQPGSELGTALVACTAAFSTAP